MLIISLGSLFFLLVFTTLYLSKSIEKRPAAMTRALDKINDNIDQLSFWGCGYGLVAAVLTLIVAHSGLGLLVGVLVNLLIFVMALPYALDKIAEKYADKLNVAIIEVLRDTVSTVVKQEKVIGYVGAGVSLLFFAVLFR